MRHISFSFYFDACIIIITTITAQVNYPSAYNNLTAGKFVAVPTSADADATGE